MTTIDLFAGAGGMSLGFEQAGFEVLFANEFEVPALETYRANFPGILASELDVRSIDASDVRKSLKLSKGDLDVLVGGPPCQGFSTYGKRAENDLRSQLYRDYFRFLEEFRPKCFVMENVQGILSMQDGAVVEDICRQASKLGYGVDVLTLDAASYGAPQYRRRVFFVGGNSGARIKRPLETHGMGGADESDLFNLSSKRQHYVTVFDAISDLPEEVFSPSDTHKTMPYPPAGRLSEFQTKMRSGSGQIHHHSAKRMLGVRKLRLKLLQPGDYGRALHARLNEAKHTRTELLGILKHDVNGRDIEDCRKQDRLKEAEIRAILSDEDFTMDRLTNAISSGGFANKYRRLHSNSPSHTLVAHMARDCSDFVHPYLDRFISVREAARLQSFPDKFIFTGSQFRQLRQIGNAVPPILGEVIAGCVSNFLCANGVREKKEQHRTKKKVSSERTPARHTA